MDYDVFISFKNTDSSGNKTEDSIIAGELYAELEKKKIHSFYSNTRLFEFGEAAYKEAIEKALDQAKVLIAIATDAEYLKTRWVSYERESFHEDILSGRKKKRRDYSFLKKRCRQRRTALVTQLRNFFKSIKRILLPLCPLLKNVLLKLCPPQPLPKKQKPTNPWLRANPYRHIIQRRTRNFADLKYRPKIREMPTYPLLNT